MWLNVTKEKQKGKVPHDERPVTSKQDPPLKSKYANMKYANVEAIKDTPDCLKRYDRGKPFIPKRSLEYLPRGMRMFHD